jgi:hypothetical protein
MEKLVQQDVDSIEIGLNTDASGAYVDGSSVKITATNAKASAFSDSSQDSTVKREFTWLLRPATNGENLKIEYGKFS